MIIKKYIKFKDNSFAIWPSPSISHSMMVRILNRSPITAGFIDDSGECYGESISLRLKADSKDTQLLINYLGYDN